MSYQGEETGQLIARFWVVSGSQDNTVRNQFGVGPISVEGWMRRRRQVCRV